MSNYLYSTGANHPRWAGKSARGETSQGANEPGGERARRRTGKGVKKPDTVIMCREYKLPCLNWCSQLLPCFDGKLCLIYWWKMFIVSALNIMLAWNPPSCDPKTQPSRVRCVLVQCLAWSVKIKLSPQVRESDHFGHVFVVQW